VCGNWTDQSNEGTGMLQQQCLPVVNCVPTVFLILRLGCGTGHITDVAESGATTACGSRTEGNLDRSRFDLG